MTSKPPPPCSGCGKCRPTWKRVGADRYCQICWRMRAPKPAGTAAKPKQVKPIAPRSKRKIQQDAAYSQLRKVFLSEPAHACCRAGFAGCTGCQPDRLTVHHKRGRGIYLLRTDTWLTLCVSCHQYVTDHSAIAVQLGFTQSRLS